MVRDGAGGPLTFAEAGIWSKACPRSSSDPSPGIGNSHPYVTKRAKIRDLARHDRLALATLDFPPNLSPSGHKTLTPLDHRCPLPASAPRVLGTERQLLGSTLRNSTALSAWSRRQGQGIAFVRVHVLLYHLLFKT